MDNNKEYIICAAWKRKIPRSTIDNSVPYHVHNDILNIELGYRHHDIYSRFGEELSLESGCMGFYTSFGRFVDRTEAMKLAFECGQVTEKRAKWTEKEINLLPDFLQDTKPGDFKSLASEDLYCCSPDGNSLSE